MGGNETWGDKPFFSVLLLRQTVHGLLLSCCFLSSYQTLVFLTFILDIGLNRC